MKHRPVGEDGLECAEGARPGAPRGRDIGECRSNADSESEWAVLLGDSVKGQDPVAEGFFLGVGLFVAMFVASSPTQGSA
jgi:hypothetical protein